MIAKTKRAILATAAISVLAFVTASPASAGVANVYSSQFNGAETPAGSFTPSALAVAPDGSPWVSDSANNVVDKFDSTGKYVSQITGVAGPLAVDSTGALYVGAGFNVKKYSAAGAFLSEFNGAATPDGGFVAAGIAIDSADNVFVADVNAYTVRKFDSAGKYLSRFNGSETPFGFIEPKAIAIGVDDQIYVSDGFGGVKIFSSAGKYLLSEFAGSAASLASAPNGDVYLSYGADAVTHYTSSGSFLSEFNGAGTPQASFAAAAVAIDAAGGAYVADSAAGVVDYFAPALAPDATTEKASNFTNEAITANGSANPLGLALSECKFEYGPDASFGSSVPCAETPAEIGTGNAPVAVHADLAGLAAGDYHLRLALANANGAVKGNDQLVGVLATPTLGAQAASEPTNTEVTLSATLNPGNGASAAYFEYGTSTAYGQKSSEKVLAATTAEVNFSRPIAKLAPGTTYHYRAVVENAAGKAVGADQSFTTPAYPGTDSCANTAIRVAQGSAFLPECRAYEQVSPVAKNGVALDQLFNPPFLSADGKAIAYSTEKAAYPGAESNPFSPKALSSRSASGWSTAGVDPPMNSTGASALAYYATIALSKDLSRALVTTNAKLTADAPASGGTYLRQTATDNYTFIAPVDLSAQTSGKDFIGASDALSTVVIANTLWRQGSGSEAVAIQTGGAPFPEPSATTDPDLVDAHQVSADGSHIYFSVNGAGEEGLYLRDGNTTTLVSRADNAPSTPVPATFSSASSDGRYVIFETGGEANLTADAVPSPFASQAYRYDTETDTMTFLASGLAESGGILWGDAQSGDLYYSTGISIYYSHAGVQHLIVEVGGSQSGPEAIQVSPNGRYAAVAGVFYDAEADVAKAFPGAHLGQSSEAGVAHHRPLAILDDGSYFFDTPAPLLVADINGARDLYRYDHGKATLLSAGTQPQDAQFLAVTPDGRDVFFSTTAPLVGQDKDSVQDVYDARVEGGLASQNPAPVVACLRDDCKATPNGSPELPFGGSEGLVDSENVKAKKHCPKGRHKVRAKGKSRCVKPQHKRGKNQRANSNRRQAR